MEKAKIGIVHPKLGRGGSEAVALWTLTALKDDYDVTLITSGKVDISFLNEYYGTNLDLKEFSLIQVPLPFGLGNTKKFAAIRGGLIQRYCQGIALNFDLMISSYNPCDFKTKGIQFATDIQELSAIISLKGWKRWWYDNTLLREAYLKVYDWVSSGDREGWKKNLTLAISKWTAKLMRQKYGVESQVIYPPVVSKFPPFPYEKRENGFVCVGRIVPEKRIDKIIEVLGKVRQRGHNIHLHIIGGIEDNHYGKFLKNLSQKHQEWIFFEGCLNEKGKKEFIIRHRFGISARKNEPFGIAVAEMVKAGCIVFVVDGGGQVEIVDHIQLIYKDDKDAVEKIEQVLKSNTTQIELREHLATQSQKFSIERFMTEIKEVVHQFLKER